MKTEAEMHHLKKKKKKRKKKKLSAVCRVPALRLEARSPLRSPARACPAHLLTKFPANEQDDGGVMTADISPFKKRKPEQ